MRYFYTLQPPEITCLVTSECGGYGKGKARCHPVDLWDESFGKKLAEDRALMDYHKREVKKDLIKSRANSKHKNFHIAEDMLFDYGYELDDIGINLIAKILDNAKIAKRIKI